WYWEFLTKVIGLSSEKLYISVFEGHDNISRDSESEKIWTEILEKEGLNPKDRIYFYGVDKNWWSRAGLPADMPKGEPGGPDSEVFYDFGTPHDKKFGEKCHPNCQCGRFLEIGNSVFMEYIKKEDGTFGRLPNNNVDFGGGLERLLAAVENQADIFQTSLFSPIVSAIEKTAGKSYKDNKQETRIIIDHLIGSVFISSSNVRPSNKEQGYILRRLLRRAFDNFYKLGGKDITPVIHKIVEQYRETDPALQKSFEEIKLIILEEEKNYKGTLLNAIRFIEKKYGGRMEITGDWISGWLKEKGGETKDMKEISPDDAFVMYTTHGLSPTQIKGLGYIFNEQEFAKKMEEHQNISRKGAGKKFAGGLADHSDKTIMGHTATHLMHQALRDVLGDKVFQTGSNITSERIRFDFSFDKKLTDEEILEVEKTVNKKIEEDLPVRFEIMPLKKAEEIGAIGLFDEKYEDNVKVYFIGGPSTHSVRSGQPRTQAYSVEFCGGPHVEFTGKLKRFKIIKQENIGHGQRRIYAKIGAFL
ncbi:MAG: alanine--tRNA ligase-related protein, partial [Patescibacteria group bacterium]